MGTHALSWRMNQVVSRCTARRALRSIGCHTVVKKPKPIFSYKNVSPGSSKTGLLLMTGSTQYGQINIFLVESRWFTHHWCGLNREWEHDYWALSNWNIMLYVNMWYERSIGKVGIALAHKPNKSNLLDWFGKLCATFLTQSAICIILDKLWTLHHKWNNRHCRNKFSQICC